MAEVSLIGQDADMNVAVKISDHSITVNSTTITLPVPTIQMKWTSSLDSYKKILGLGCEYNFNTKKWNPYTYNTDGRPILYNGTTVLGRWYAYGSTYVAKNTYTTLSWIDSGGRTINTNSIFTSTNKTSKIAYIYLKANTNCAFNGIEKEDGGAQVGDLNNSTKILATYTIILNAPPVFNIGYPQISNNTNNIYYKDITTITINVGAVAQYSGNITETKLTLGSQVAYGDGNGIITLKPNTIGEFTPTLTVTDSRGQVTSYEFNPITVIQGDDVEYTASQAVSNTSNLFYATKSTASTTINVTELPYQTYGETVDNIKFTIGQQSVTSTSVGTITSDILTIPGTYTPTVELTTTFGRTFTKQLNSIQVKSYIAPTVELDVERVGVDGKVEDEGKFCLLKLTINSYTYEISSLIKPTVTIAELNNYDVTWYTSWSMNGGVVDNTQITWPYELVNSSSNLPKTIYGIAKSTTSPATGLFQIDSTYDISIQVIDNRNISSTVSTERLPQAFFTIDVYGGNGTTIPGGRGIAFGKMATQEGFECNMDTTFNKQILLLLDGNASSGIDAQLLSIIDILGWDVFE